MEEQLRIINHQLSCLNQRIDVIHRGLACQEQGLLTIASSIGNSSNASANITTCLQGVFTIGNISIPGDIQMGGFSSLVGISQSSLINLFNNSPSCGPWYDKVKIFTISDGVSTYVVIPESYPTISGTTLFFIINFPQELDIEDDTNISVCVTCIDYTTFIAIARPF